MKLGRLVVCALLAASVLLAAGCSEDNDKLFTGSSSKIRDGWANARKLDAANEFLRAAQAYDELVNAGLSKQQTAAVQKAVDQLYERLKKAAAKGDREAKQILIHIQECEQQDKM